MSLNWQWSDKMGEVTYKDGSTKSNLYRGNCFMIAVNEWVSKEGVEQYSLAWFFADEAHAKNCLGLTKGYEDNSPDDWGWLSFKLDTSYKETGKFLQLLAKAKAKGITITLY